jgi:fused signal recognition particle receptor
MTDEKSSWWQRLKSGLTKSTTQLTESITAVFTKRKLDAAALEELEEILIKADLGPAVAAQLVADFSKARFGKDVDEREVREALAGQIAVMLEPVAKPLVCPETKPTVLLMVGVNGAGKTTTLGKMAKAWRDEGKKVLLVAGDTFRAAAVAQLKVWAERAGCEILTGSEGSDPAALAYQAVTKAKAEDFDIVLIDTAGRLQNKEGLMQELAKIIRVLKKQDATLPHSTLLVLDATAGQNALAQVGVFKEMAAITGLVVTKLDGSAKGGILVALAATHKLPVHAIGVGEGIADLRPFTARGFARALMGLEEEA